MAQAVAVEEIIGFCGAFDGDYVLIFLICGRRAGGCARGSGDGG